MSGNVRSSSDRRVERSRAALVSAFGRLIQARGFDDLTAAEVADAANVGRSTFYNHFAGLSDLLCAAVDPVLTPLANAAVDGDDPHLAAMLDHVWENRVMGRKLLAGGDRRNLLHLLASKIEARLIERALSDAPLAALTAVRIAGGQLSLLEHWLSGRAPGSAAEVARVLRGACS